MSSQPMYPEGKKPYSSKVLERSRNTAWEADATEDALGDALEDLLEELEAQDKSSKLGNKTSNRLKG